MKPTIYLFCLLFLTACGEFILNTKELDEITLKPISTYNTELVVNAPNYTGFIVTENIYPGNSILDKNNCFRPFQYKRKYFQIDKNGKEVFSKDVSRTFYYNLKPIGSYLISQNSINTDQQRIALFNEKLEPQNDLIITINDISSKKYNGFSSTVIDIIDEYNFTIAGSLYNFVTSKNVNFIAEIQNNKVTNVDEFEESSSFINYGLDMLNQKNDLVLLWQEFKNNQSYSSIVVLDKLSKTTKTITIDVSNAQYISNLKRLNENEILAFGSSNSGTGIEYFLVNTKTGKFEKKIISMSIKVPYSYPRKINDEIFYVLNIDGKNQIHHINTNLKSIHVLTQKSIGYNSINILKDANGKFIMHESIADYSNNTKSSIEVHKGFAPPETVIEYSFPAVKRCFDY